MHELSKRLFERIQLDWNRTSADDVITKYLKERAEWLKKNMKITPTWGDYVDQAFQIEEESLEEMLSECNNPSFENLAKLAKEYFQKHPEKLKE